MKHRIHYCSTMPGTGKTSWAVKAINTIVARNQVVVYTAPTLELLREVENYLLNSGVSKHVINLVHANDGTNLPALRHAMLCLKGGKAMDAQFHVTTPMVLLCTHQTFIRLPDGEYRKDCHVIYDEARKCIGDSEQVVIKDPNPLLPYLELGKLMTPKFPANADFDRSFGSNRNNRSLRPLVYKIRRMSESKVWVTWCKLTKGADGIYRLTYITLLNVDRIFSGWKTVTLLTAYFESSQLRHLMLRNGNFILTDVTARAIDPKVVAAVKKRISNTSITYVFENDMVTMQDLTKGILTRSINIKEVQKQMDKLGVYLNPSYIESIKALDQKRNVSLDWRAQQVLSIVKLHRIGTNRPISYAVSKSIELNREWSSTRGLKERRIPITINRDQVQHCPHQGSWTPMPFQSQGLNKFQSHNTIAFLATVFPQPYIFDLMQELCPDYDIELDYVVEQAIQTAMRCSIRNTKARTKPLIIVTTKHLAQRMARHMQGLPTVVSPTSICPTSIARIVRFTNNIPEKNIDVKARARWIEQQMKERVPTYKKWKQLTILVVVNRHRGKDVSKTINERDTLRQKHCQEWAEYKSRLRLEFDKSK